MESYLLTWELYILHTIRRNVIIPRTLQLPFSPTIPQHSHPHPYLTNHVNHVFMFLSYCISYKAISLPLVAAVASAAAVAVASAAAVVPLAGASVVTATAEVVVGATAAIRTTSDLTHFRL